MKFKHKIGLNLSVLLGLAVFYSLITAFLRDVINTGNGYIDTVFVTFFLFIVVQIMGMRMRV